MHRKVKLTVKGRDEDKIKVQGKLKMKSIVPHGKWMPFPYLYLFFETTYEKTIQGQIRYRSMEFEAKKWNHDLHSLRTYDANYKTPTFFVFEKSKIVDKMTKTV